MRRSLLVSALAIVCGALTAHSQENPEDRPPDQVDLSSPEVVIPFQLVKGRPIVDVTLDGKGPFPFILDTGAGGTVIGADVADELQLPKVGETRIGDPIHPHGMVARTVRVGKVAIGGATFSPVVATAMDDPMLREHTSSRGVLGMPLFANVLLTVDYKKSEIRVTRGELPDANGKDVVPYKSIMGIRVPITVGVLELDADLDTGSPAALSLPDTYMDRLPLEGKPVEIGRARTVTSEFAVYAATLKGDVRIGGYRLENPSLRFNKLPIANIGGEVLGRFAITIDQKNRRIRFAPQEGEPHAGAASGGAAGR